MKKKQKALILLVSACLLSACATPASVTGMTVNKSYTVASSSSTFRNNLAMKDVTGGDETNPMWKSNIGTHEFEKAIETSLQNAGLLALPQGGTHFLTVHLVKVDQPMIGLDMTVTATVNYVVTERATGKNIYSKDIAIPYTATFSDAFAGYERLRLANEGAARKNIEKFIDDILGLNVDSIALK